MSTYLLRIDKPLAKDGVNGKDQPTIHCTQVLSRKHAMTEVLRQFEANEAPSHYEIHEV